MPTAKAQLACCGRKPLAPLPLQELRVQVFRRVDHASYGEVIRNACAPGAAKLLRERRIHQQVHDGIRDRAPYLTTMQKRVQRYACQFADCILVNAEAVKEWLIGEGYDAARISVIRNGVDLSRFDNPPAPVQLRRELGLPDDTPLVGVVSRLTRLKGLEHFLEAAAMIKARVPTVRFLIVGETSPMDRGYLGELQRYAERCGVAPYVTFTGLRNDVPAVLASLTVSVMPVKDRKSTRLNSSH